MTQSLREYLVAQSLLTYLNEHIRTAKAYNLYCVSIPIDTLTQQMDKFREQINDIKPIPEPQTIRTSESMLIEIQGLRASLEKMTKERDEHKRVREAALGALQHFITLSLS